MLTARVLQATIVLVPGWITAYLSDGQIACVAPVLVAMTFLAAGFAHNDKKVDDSEDDIDISQDWG